MGDSACVMFSHDSILSNESQRGNSIQVLGDSISFGRFVNEPLSWEKWSTFAHKKYVEEAESYSQPGSVAQKKAFFEAHYKRIAAQKSASLLEQETDDSAAEGEDNGKDENINHSQRISLKLNSHIADDEKMEVVKSPDSINGAVNSCQNSSATPADIVGDKDSGKKPPSKKRFFSKSLFNLCNLISVKEHINPPNSAKEKKRAMVGVSNEAAVTPPTKNRRKKTLAAPSAPGRKTSNGKWHIFSAVQGEK